MNSPIITLPKIVLVDELILCPSCGKQLACGESRDYNHEKNYWYVIDNFYNEEWGGIPVEVIEL